MNSPSNGSRNRLLAALSHADRDLLTPALETIALDVRHVLEVPNGPISHVYFVESGLISIVGTAAPEHRIEIGMVGYEGMTGLSIVLGGDRSTNEALVQASGSALRISTESLRGMLEASRSLTATLPRYVNVFMVQGSQTALANVRAEGGWIWQSRAILTLTSANPTSASGAEQTHRFATLSSLDALASVL